MEDRNPLISVALGSFDLLSGVKVIESWMYKDSLGVSLDDIFKMVLSNVHRQSEESFSSFLSSTFEVQSMNLIISSSIFMIKKKPYNIYYSLVLVFDIIETCKTNNSISMFISHSSFLAAIAKNLITQNDDIKKMEPMINETRKKCLFYSISRISELPALDVSPSDSLFLSIVLSSHLQTQMTTVIEAETKEEASFISSFLAHFLLPCQLEHSSLELRDTIVDGLFLQCVKPQEMYIDELMLTFRNPTTYVKLPERVVFITPSAEKQKLINEDWRDSLTLDKQSMKRKIGAIRGQHKIYLKKVSAPCPWSMVTLSLITQVPPENQKKICELQFTSIFKMALAAAAYLDNASIESSILSNEECSDICKELKITGADDLNMILSIAHIFDSSINWKIPQKR